MLFQCPECGNMVSDKASQCPKCGYAVPKGTSAPSNLATNVSKENNATKIRSCNIMNLCSSS